MPTISSISVIWRKDGKGGQLEAASGQSLRNTGTDDNEDEVDNVDDEEDNDDEGRQISAACAPQSSSSSSRSSSLSKQQVLHNLRKPGTVTVHFIQRPPSPTPLDTSRPSFYHN